MSSAPLVSELSNFAAKRYQSVVYWSLLSMASLIGKADPRRRSSGERSAWIAKVPTLLSASDNNHRIFFTKEEVLQ